MPAPHLNVLVYSARAWRLSAWLATGRRPLTSPPLGPRTFDPEQLRGRQVLYFKLHGLPGEPRWYGTAGDAWQDAIDVETIRAAAPLGRCVVFAQACFSRESPMVQALLEAGAAAVVGSEATLTAGRYWPRASDWLGRDFLQALGAGFSAGQALAVARIRLSQKPGVTPGQLAGLSVVGESTRSVG